MLILESGISGIRNLRNPESLESGISGIRNLWNPESPESGISGIWNPNVGVEY
ncbi:MAG: hypothetical protein IPK58_07100 [Acidobacteria bacterium]|nr:hypothetical protein [Acidobacteriota bacterium]